MNGRTAKKIRKKIYGSDFSPKQRDYDHTLMKTKTGKTERGIPFQQDCITIKATGLRRKYKDAKKAYKDGL